MTHISKIAVLRKAAGLTQAQLASLLDVTENTVQNWEKGKGNLKWIERVIKLCRLFECTPEGLVELVPQQDQLRMNQLRNRINKNEIKEVQQ